MIKAYIKSFHRIFPGWQLWTFVAIFGGYAAAGQVQAASLKPAALRCEYRVDPLGIDEIAPRLSWQVESNLRGDRQTAFQVLVASTPELLDHNQGDLWDSGRVASDETIGTAYAGQPLDHAAGVKPVRMEKDLAVLEVESGSYHFVVKN
jgi:hypothetical protein